MALFKGQFLNELRVSFKCLVILRSSYLYSEASCNFMKKETMAQVFSCELCEFSKNNFFTEHLRATASGI